MWAGGSPKSSSTLQGFYINKVRIKQTSLYHSCLHQFKMELRILLEFSWYNISYELTLISLTVVISNSCTLSMLHLGSSAQCCKRYADVRRLSVRAKMKYCAFQTPRMLKRTTSVLSKQGSQEEITLNKKERLDNLVPTTCFTNAALWARTVLGRVRASYWRRTPVALTALQGTTEMEHSILVVSLEYALRHECGEILVR